MKKFKVLYLAIASSLVFSTGFSTVYASSDGILVQDNDTVIMEGEESLDTIIDAVSKGVEINKEEEQIELNDPSSILENISQEDIDNLNALAEELGVAYGEPLTKEGLVELFENGIETINKEIEDGKLEMLENGSLIDADDSDFYIQGGSTYDKTYWWGKARYKSTANANKWVSQLNTAGNANAGAAFVAGAIFGGVGAIPNGLTSVYCYQLANKVSYRNSLNTRGIVANLTWLLVFTVKSQ